MKNIEKVTAPPETSDGNVEERGAVARRVARLLHNLDPIGGDAVICRRSEARVAVINVLGEQRALTEAAIVAFLRREGGRFDMQEEDIELAISEIMSGSYRRTTSDAIMQGLSTVADVGGNNDH